MNTAFAYDRYDISLYTIGELVWRRMPLSLRPGGKDADEFNELSLREQEYFLAGIKESMTSTVFNDAKIIEKKSEPTNDKPRTATICEELCEVKLTPEGFQDARTFIETSWSRVTGVRAVLEEKEARDLRTDFISARRLFSYILREEIQDEKLIQRTKEILTELLQEYVKIFNQAHGGIYVPQNGNAVSKELRTLEYKGGSLKLTRFQL